MEGNSDGVMIQLIHVKSSNPKDYMSADLWCRFSKQAFPHYAKNNFILIYV